MGDLFSLGARVLGGQIAAKRAREMAESARIAARPPRSSFRPIDPPLPVERWYSGPLARFGYPWGWSEVDAGQTVEDDVDVLCLLSPDRYDGVTAGVQALRIDRCTTEQLMDTAATLHEDRAQVHGLSPHGAMQRVEVDGEPALVIHLTGAVGTGTQRSIATEVFVAHRRQLFQVQLVSPDVNHAAYLQILWTVLGTWSWA